MIALVKRQYFDLLSMFVSDLDLLIKRTQADGWDEDG